jgi:hypothetical protein
MFFRLQKSAHYALFRYRTRALQRSRPIPCNIAAACEVHTMLTLSDVPMYLVAIKSLLRFYQDLAVVVHSDGSLDQAAVRSIERHVPGARFVDPHEAAARAATSLSPELAAWRLQDVSYQRLFDTGLWTRTARRFIFDADMLVISRPDELIDWVLHGERPVLLGGDEVAAPVPEPRGHIQNFFRYHLEEISRRMDRPALFLQGTSAGLYGCAGELDFDTVGKLLRVATECGVPMTQWGGEQCTVIYLLSSAGGSPLNPSRYFNFGPEQLPKLPGAAIVHFFGTYRFYQGIYPRAAQAVAEGLPRRIAPA